MNGKQTVTRTASSRIVAARAFVLALLRKEGRNRVYRAYLKAIGRIVSREDRMRLCRDEMLELIEPEERFLIPSFEKGSRQEQDRFLAYQQRYIPFKIRQGEKVLDIGSGGHPFPHATHLADLHLNGTSHRSEPLRMTGLPLQICNIGQLPYRSKTFDFVYCSHVLEHVSDPAKACEELMRVGARGYIETPTRLSDVMFNFIRLREHHLWHVNCVGSTLVFMQWEDRERRDTHINEFFSMAKSKYKNPFQDLFHEHRDLFVNMMLWEDRFSYCVIDKAGNIVEASQRMVSRSIY